MYKNKKILFTTTYNKDKKPVDLFGLGTRKTLLRFTFPRITSYGLRFIKQNIPSIEIIEYPTFEEYKKKIDEGWDIVGFSFYIMDIPEVKKMIKYARDKGVKEIWGGNYGVLTDGIKKYFDKIFYGYAEHEIAELLDLKINDIVHPPLINLIGNPIGIKFDRVGIIFSSRGCSMKCSFCQGPKFIDKPHKISIQSINRVLKYYKKIGIDEIAIADESFGMFKEHSKQVVDLLKKYNFYWTALTRVDLTYKNYDNWAKNGLSCVLLGIESFNQKTLDKINKKEDINHTIELIKKMHKTHRFAIGYYIIGFEDDTVESIKKDIIKLKNLNLFLTHVNVLTPLPKTDQWYDFDERFGIFEKDYHKWDGRYLVFNHPFLDQKDIDDIYAWSQKTLFPISSQFKMLKMLISRYSEGENGLIRAIIYMFKQQLKAFTYDFSIKKGKIFSDIIDHNNIDVTPIYK